MPISPTFRIAASTLLLCLLTPLSQAADSSAADDERASRLKDEAAQLRDQAEATYQATEPQCYERFLVNRCIDAAKQARLDDIRRARALESEARKLELAARQRAADEAMRNNPGAPQQAPATSPAADPTIRATPEAERMRSERSKAAAEAEREAVKARATQDAERAAERSKAQEAAAQRAEQAARERERYDERIREYEEKKARDASGR
ncbi:hypothetical protein CEW83_17150 [Parazoarcus communis]|uniref:Uncharacterized protein n=1 Tax=Parazoarcus communis TaxID=41977 RepID=A0A2U8GTE5_9RHOO|nr:hypothetical protein [Parazoarcus communis]AWI76728.1 hypothetical protein CEW83_17150 [Parazoarcus communis]